MPGPASGRLHSGGPRAGAIRRGAVGSANASTRTTSFGWTAFTGESEGAMAGGALQARASNELTAVITCSTSLLRICG